MKKSTIKHRNRVVTPIVSVGMALEEAAKSAGKPIEAVQRTNYYAAAIRVNVPDGQLTCSAQRHFNVDLLVGPTDIDKRSDSPGAFASRVMAVKLHFSPFTFDDATGRMSRGSMTLAPMWQGVCAACGAVVAANRLLRQRRSSKQAVCKRCGAANAFSQKKLERKKLESSSAGVAELYKLHTVGDAKQARLAMPRAWAIYRENNAPTEWIPKADDGMAMSLAIKASYNGMEIRPAQHAIMSQSKATSAFVLEGTSGFRAGWLTYNELTGGTVNACGYKLQAAPMFRRGQLAL
jgi:hypothetical protein